MSNDSDSHKSVLLVLQCPNIPLMWSICKFLNPHDQIETSYILDEKWASKIGISSWHDGSGDIDQFIPMVQELDVKKLKDYLVVFFIQSICWCVWQQDMMSCNVCLSCGVASGAVAIWIRTSSRRCHSPVITWQWKRICLTYSSPMFDSITKLSEAHICIFREVFTAST